jgi:hypothetical protein
MTETLADTAMSHICQHFSFPDGGVGGVGGEVNKQQQPTDYDYDEYLSLQTDFADFLLSSPHPSS